jgi:hypothetical protein
MGVFSSARAVLSLDCTGTLFRVKGNDVAHHYLSSAQRLAPLWGFSLLNNNNNKNDEEEVDKRLMKAFGESYKQQSKVLPAFGSGFVTSRDWWQKVVSQTFTALLHQPSPTAPSSSSASSSSSSPSPSFQEFERGLRRSREFQEVFGSLFEAFGRQECWEVFPDALQLLQTAQPLRSQKKLQIVLISNFDERLVGSSTSFFFLLSSFFLFVTAYFSLVAWSGFCTWPEGVGG